MESFIVEKDIEIPARRYGKNTGDGGIAKRVVNSLKRAPRGGSIFIPCPSGNQDKNFIPWKRSFQSMICGYARQMGLNLTTRTMVNGDGAKGIRTWRL